MLEYSQEWGEWLEGDSVCSDCGEISKQIPSHFLTWNLKSHVITKW